ncbi:MAG: hypothetical protein JWO06_2766 [Bacteroidota bacterium]|nr:hypothetical protein [Bacteroidota bacterium]
MMAESFRGARYGLVFISPLAFVFVATHPHRSGLLVALKATTCGVASS